MNSTILLMNTISCIYIVDNLLNINTKDFIYFNNLSFHNSNSNILSYIQTVQDHSRLHRLYFLFHLHKNRLI